MSEELSTRNLYLMVKEFVDEILNEYDVQKFGVGEVLSSLGVDYDIEDTEEEVETVVVLPKGMP